MNFEIPDEVGMIQKTIDGFVEKEIEPLEDEHARFLGEDREMEIMEGTGTDYRMCDAYLDLWKEIRTRSAEAGIWSMHMPERVGGGGLDALSFILLVEYMENRTPSGLHRLMWDTGTCTAMMIPAYDDDYQREKYFEPMMSGEALGAFALTEPDHGSDATYMDSTAERDDDGWMINGTKAFISKGAVADYSMVFARTSGKRGDTEGITAFLVDADNPGFSVDKVQRSMGGQPGRQAIVSYTDCHVGDEQVLGEVNKGFAQLIQWIGFGRLKVPAAAVGRSQWLLDQTVEYANQRKTFGKEIARRQGIQFQIAEAATDIEQVRWLTRYAAWKYDQGSKAIKEQSMANLRGSQLWNDVADTALQVHGGAGFMRSLGIEAEYREARGSRIYEGTDEMQRRTIARKTLGL